MLILQLDSFPIEQIEDLEALEARLGAWAAAQSFPWRLLAYSRPFDMSALIEDAQPRTQLLQMYSDVGMSLFRAALGVRSGAAPHPAAVFEALPAEQRAQIRLAASSMPMLEDLPSRPWNMSPEVWKLFSHRLCHQAWSLPWRKEMTRFYEVLGQKHLRSASYYLLTWEPSDLPADALVASLEQATGRPVTLCDQLPPVLATQYYVDEQNARLVPTTPGQPYLAVLRSYDMGGEWNATTLHALLSFNFDVSVALDVVTIPHGAALKGVELSKRTAATLLRDGKVEDARAERLLLDAADALHRLDGESLHDVQIAVLVAADSAEQLAAHVASVRDRLGSTLRLDAVSGAQRQLLRLWSTTPAERIDAPLRRYNMFSQGLGCCLGLLGYHRARRTDGPLWGLDMVRRAPLFYDLFADNQAAHGVVLGKTGYGKSFFLNVLTMRAAVLSQYRVIALDAFKNGARLELVTGAAGGVCNWLGMSNAINVLDVVHDDQDGPWIPDQVQHAIGQLSLVLGKTGQVTTGAETKETLVPCVFSDGEEGVLDRALSDMYAGVDPRGAPTDMPLMSDLIAGLERIDEPEARDLARRLRMKLFGSSTGKNLTTLGRSLNQPSQVSWSFDLDINYFDVSGVPERLRGFYYAHAVGAINRYMRRKGRDTQRRTLLLMDEFHYITRVEAVARLAADICKVARKYGIGLLAVDQNPGTFLDSVYGTQIFENAVAKFLFHLDDLPARRMADAMSDLTPQHVRFLTQAGKGRCLSVFGNDVYHMLVEPTSQELRAFCGS